MAFSEEDKIVIKFLRQNKKYGAKKFLKKFPNKGWTLGGLKYLIRKIDLTESCKRRKGSGRPRVARTTENIEKVEDLVLSQEDRPQSHLTLREIARETGISKTSVHEIVKTDLHLKCLKKRRATELTEANKEARLERSRILLDRYPDEMVNFIWFTDEKLFTIATPKNSQNDRLYVATGTRKKNIPANRLLSTRPTFSQSVMVSVGVSALGKTDIHFIEPGVKINGAYYRDSLLLEKLLPDIRQYSDYYTFQQDGAPAHRARETVELLIKETPDFIPPNLWPPNSPDLNPVDYKIWGIMQEKVYKTKVRNIEELRERIVNAWDEFDQLVVDAAVSQWRVRLVACVEANGGHFEHKL
jgi:AcrR family transcriptional regulator